METADYIFYFAYVGFALWYWCGYTVGKKVERRRNINSLKPQQEFKKNQYTAKGKELIFISTISRDGNRTSSLKDIDMKHLNETEFNINCLSITNRTYIASEFNSYVVRCKDCKIKENFKNVKND